MTNRNPFKTISEKVVYQSPFMTVMEHAIVHPDGQPGVYSFLSMPGSVVIVPVNDAGEICLVKLWRYPIEQFSWEVPMGGLLDADEEPVVAAKRELLEESGLVAHEWIELMKNHPSSPNSNEVATIYLARNLTQQPFTDTNEITEVKYFSIEKVLEMIDSQEITNVEAISGILLAIRRLEKIA